MADRPGETGFDTVGAGPSRKSWRFQAGYAAYASALADVGAMGTT